MNLFCYGCAGSLLLCGLFSSCGERGHLSRCVRASHCVGFSCRGAQALGCTGSRSRHTWAKQSQLPPSTAQAQELAYLGLGTLQNVRSSQIRDRTSTSCIGRWILYHQTTREAHHFLIFKNYLGLFFFF